jgi:hypothetical protein
MVLDYIYAWLDNILIQMAFGLSLVNALRVRPIMRACSMHFNLGEKISRPAHNYRNIGGNTIILNAFGTRVSGPSVTRLNYLKLVLSEWAPRYCILLSR